MNYTVRIYLMGHAVFSAVISQQEGANMKFLHKSNDNNLKQYVMILFSTGEISSQMRIPFCLLGCITSTRSKHCIPKIDLFT